MALIRWTQRLFKRSPAQPLRFDNSNFKILPASQNFEEEAFDDFSTGRYLPVRIGEVLDTRYQVVGKLGFGLGSTVWMAYDLHKRRKVALKVFTNDRQNREEVNIYKHLMSIKSDHPGRHYLRKALRTFTLQGPKGEHQCLVHKPMWGKSLLKAFLVHLFLALDYLHTEAHLIHTDISAGNILMEINDQSIVTAFIKAEQEHPSPRKEVDGYTVYISRRFDSAKGMGQPFLSDFGSAVSGEVEHNERAQPNSYRSPEVCLKMPWSYSIDIWNVGVLIDFKLSDLGLVRGKYMFYGQDPKEKRYTTRAHLAEMIAMMGPPPPDFLKLGKRTAEFFTEDGQWRGEIPIPSATSLEESEENFKGSDQRAFLEFMRKMLQWRPEDRQTAGQLLQDPWLNAASYE
ncbi:CMGC protein kinase [Pholiota molesta]|nr:CMGC protein kinase [Pholiota molesta]